MSNTFPGLDDAYDEVRLFHIAFGLPVSQAPQALSASRLAARVAWMQEELSELRASKSLEEQVDAVLDVIYLSLGCLVEMGVKPGIPFTHVHETNLRKKWPGGEVRVDSDGKIVKPPDWIGPRQAISEYLSQLPN